MSVAIGATAPEFELVDTAGASWSADGAEATATVIVFTCNHCPYALAWHDRLAQVARDYADRGVRVLADQLQRRRPLSARLLPGDADTGGR